MSTTSRQWYDAAEIATEMGVDVKTVLHWIHAGELEAVNVARDPQAKRPRWKISAAALRAFSRRRSTYGPGGDDDAPRRGRPRKSKPRVAYW